jgi:uncharacterized protein
LQDSLLRFGDWVVENGIDSEGRWRAGRDLLLRRNPRLTSYQRGTEGPGLLRDAEPILDGANRLALALDGGVLPVQGPPGSGKTYSGARMIVELIRAGKKVGITAVSHKVIQNLLMAVVEAAGEEGTELLCVQRVGECDEEMSEQIKQVTDNGEMDEAIAGRRTSDDSFATFTDAQAAMT